MTEGASIGWPPLKRKAVGAALRVMREQREWSLTDVMNQGAVVAVIADVTSEQPLTAVLRHVVDRYRATTDAGRAAVEAPGGAIAIRLGQRQNPSGRDGLSVICQSMLTLSPECSIITT